MPKAYECAFSEVDALNLFNLVERRRYDSAKSRTGKAVISAVRYWTVNNPNSVGTKIHVYLRKSFSLARYVTDRFTEPV